MDAIFWHSQPDRLPDAIGWPAAENSKLILFNLDCKSGQLAFKGYACYSPLEGLMKNFQGAALGLL